MPEQTVTLEIKGRIAYLGFNRPEAMNAMNVEMLEEILNKLNELKNTEADILIIYGNGKGFSAGGDIKTMLNEIDKISFYSIMDTISEIIVTIYSLPKLVINAVHGAAAGLGFSVALAADYIIAEENSIFAMNFIHVGLIPDGGSHFFLNKRLGDAKAKQIIWEGKSKSASEVLELGLINEIVDTNALEMAKIKAEEWLKLPIKAMLETKRIIAENSLEELKKLLEQEKRTQFEMRKTADHKEGIQAFIEKRKPNFTGK